MRKINFDWELKEDYPALWERITFEFPQVIHFYENISDQTFNDSKLDSFDDGKKVRPFRHLRAFYERLEAGGVIAIKGTEILNSKVLDKLYALKNVQVDYPSRGRSLFSVIEHFPIVEQKIPMAVTLSECKEDVSAAMKLQSAHVSFFDAFAHAPIPLAIIKWSEKVTNQFINELLPMLSPRAADIVKMVAKDGLATMLYYYPNVPYRVAHVNVEFNLNQISYQERLVKLNKLFKPSNMVDKWIDNTARMLVLKLMPSSIESIGVGHCLEAQNAVLDGGFVDLGSIKSFDDIKTQQEFVQTFSATTIDLAKTIKVFLLGAQIEATAEYRNPTFTMFNTVCKVHKELINKLNKYGDIFELDTRLIDVIQEKSVYDALTYNYNALFPCSLSTTTHNQKGSTGTLIT
jgi:hypothetical protein